MIFLFKAGGRESVKRMVHFWGNDFFFDMCMNQKGNRLRLSF